MRICLLFKASPSLSRFSLSAANALEKKQKERRGAGEREEHSLMEVLHAKKAGSL